ncbi:MAG: ABC transporter ATP-binding protein, partial [Deltaproteobacteria bacterium]|nr:ABC transporter ATP-binding protein [Deltaproteobacteria bacterium]
GDVYKRQVLDGVSFNTQRGERVAIIGPNGSGKSTLLLSLLSLIPIEEGEVFLFGEPLSKLKRQEIARRITLLEQRSTVQIPLSVREFVALGRLPYRSHQLQLQDRAAVEHSIAAVGLTEKANSDIRTLSGGEMQRAHIARVLAQDTPIILLDEATSSLDLPSTIFVLHLFRELSERGKTVCAVLHDINLALQWSTRVLLLHNRRLLFDGPPEELLTLPHLREAFGINLKPLDLGGRKWLIPCLDEFEAITS